MVFPGSFPVKVLDSWLFCLCCEIRQQNDDIPFLNLDFTYFSFASLNISASDVLWPMTLPIIFLQQKVYRWSPQVPHEKLLILEERHA